MRTIALCLALGLTPHALAASGYGHPASPMGGLQPETAPTAKLERVDVSLSHDLVEIDYYLRNDGAEPVRVPVLFEVPRYFGTGVEAGAGGVPLRNEVLAYPQAVPEQKRPATCRTKACKARWAKAQAKLKEPKPLPFKTDVRAMMCERDETRETPVGPCKDITAELKAAGLSDGQLAYYDGGPPPDNTLRKKVLPSLNPDQAEELAKAGYLDYYGFGEEWPNLPGNWGVDITYRWVLDLPAGQTTHFKQTYRPFKASGDVASGHTDQELTQALCASEAKLKAWKRRAEGEPLYLDDHRYGEVRDVVFSTGSLAKWGTPDKLSVTVHHKKDSLVLSCLPGLRPVGPTRSQTSKADLASDWRVLLAEKPVPLPVMPYIPPAEPFPAPMPAPAAGTAPVPAVPPAPAEKGAATPGKLPPATPITAGK